jgi:hypothetical protein
LWWGSTEIGGEDEWNMDYALCVYIGFLAGYGVRELISRRRRHEERRLRRAHEQLARARASTLGPG